MIFSRILVLLLLSSVFFPLWAQSIDQQFDKFDQLYKQELGSTQGCLQPELNVFRVCSKVLRNDGNGPYILHHNHVSSKVVVLFHGLSDSPFYFKSIAQNLYQQGYTVVVGLLPGHGLKQADLDMQDDTLAERWRTNVSAVIDIAADLGDDIYLGGFSTGGALLAEYTLLHPDKVKGLLLFSGALALEGSVESLSKMWGIQWILGIMDGEYNVDNPNPYKYPKVAKFAVAELLDVIFSVRELIEKNKPNLPIFAVHSVADSTTRMQGVKDFQDTNLGANIFFEIPKQLNVCHGDVVLNESQIKEINYDKSKLTKLIPCKIPQANPQHAEMLVALNIFMAAH